MVVASTDIDVFGGFAEDFSYQRGLMGNCKLEQLLHTTSTSCARNQAVLFLYGIVRKNTDLKRERWKVSKAVQEKTDGVSCAVVHDSRYGGAQRGRFLSMGSTISRRLLAPHGFSGAERGWYVDHANCISGNNNVT